ncbi:MAG: hypothetical protein ABTQ29_04620 [Siculibacillus sp.]
MSRPPVLARLRPLVTPANLPIVAVVVLVSLFVVGSWAHLRAVSVDFVPRRFAEIDRRPITSAPAYRWGETIDVRRDPRPLVRGWSYVEDGGVWSDGDVAVFAVAPERPAEGDLSLTIRARGDTDAKLRPERAIDVLVGATPIGTLVYGLGTEPVVHEMVVPREAVAAPILAISFRPRDPRSASALGLTTDPRHRGLHLVEVTLTPR